MNILITLMLCFTSIHAEDMNDIGFNYGILGQASSNPDSIMELSDESIIHTNDRVKINIAFVKKSNFYLVYIGSKGEIVMLYQKILDPELNETAQLDTIYTTALPWNSFKDPTGNETFYFINSSTPLTELTKLIGRYDKAPEKAKVKLANRIQGQIDDLDPNIQGDLALIPNRLDKPMLGGVAFRGEDDDLLRDMSLTHVCTGSDGLAFQKIVLNHK